MRTKKKRAAKKKREPVRHSGSTKLKVGTPVTLKHGLRRIRGTIVDDMGKIGIGGRRIYSVRARLDGLNEEVFDAREDELRPSKRKTAA